jgi:hypothetical protein
MDIRSTCPGEHKESYGEDDGADAANLEPGFWWYRFAGWGGGSRFFVIVVLKRGEECADDQSNSDTEESESSNTGCLSEPLGNLPRWRLT